MAELRKVSIDSLDETQDSQILNIASQKNMVTDDYIRIYVDNSVNVSGNGSSWETAFKTLPEAMSLLNDNFHSEFRIYLQSGTYYFPNEVKSISNISLHLVTNYENTEIHINSSNALAWYNCHLRISPDTATLDSYKNYTYAQLTVDYSKICKVYINNGMYFDGGYCLLDYVYLYNKNGNVTMNGGYFEAFRCFMGCHIIGRASTLKFDGSHFSYNNTWYAGHNSFINAQNSNVQIKPYKTNKLYGTDAESTTNDYRTIFNGGGKTLEDANGDLSAINCAFNTMLTSLYQVHMTNYTTSQNNVSSTCGVVFGRYRGLGATTDADITLSHTLTSISTN